MADALHFTGNEEADALLAKEPLALLIGFALDQQVPVQTAFTGPLKLQQRLGTLDAGRIAATDPAELDRVFREKPAIHRFPSTMAERVQDLCAHVAETYGGRSGGSVTPSLAPADAEWPRNAGQRGRYAVEPAGSPEEADPGHLRRARRPPLRGRDVLLGRPHTVLGADRGDARRAPRQAARQA